VKGGVEKERDSIQLRQSLSLSTLDSNVDSRPKRHRSVDKIAKTQVDILADEDSDEDTFTCHSSDLSPSLKPSSHYSTL